MWFAEMPSQKYFLATVFYSEICVSKCLAGENSQVFDEPGESGVTSVQTFRTEVPWPPISLDPRPNTFAIVAWMAVLSVAVCVAIIVCVCCICFKLYPCYNPRRQSSNAALFPNPPASSRVRFTRDRTRRGNDRNSGITNMAFTGGLQNAASSPQIEDRPPPYSAVISVTSDKLPNVQFSQVGDTKPVETPPPAYITVAPFQ